VNDRDSRSLELPLFDSPCITSC